MLTQNDIADFIREEFPFSPQVEQALLIEELARFVYGFRTPEAFVLKGYAGTGKTSLVGALVRAMPKLRIQTVLLAPTGRAAKVLSAYSQQSAYTIHKQIYQNQRDAFGRWRVVLQKNKYRNTLFIIDEASMLADELQSTDSLFAQRSLLEDLLNYVSSGFQCKLILIGDTAQLPPVGSEISPALDLEYLSARYGLLTKSFELKEVLRQAKASEILKNATYLREKIAKDDIEFPLFLTSENCPDFILLKGDELEDALYSAYSNLAREEVVLITRSNKRANLFNKEIRYRILGQEDQISTGDYLMVLKNNYYWLPKTSEAGFIANGDTVEVLRIRKIEDIYGLRFADVQIRLVDYPKEPTYDVKIVLDSLDVEAASLPASKWNELWNLLMEENIDITQKYKRVQAVKENPYFNALQVKFAYALTCHKTQGGQWNTVFVDHGYFTDDMLNTEYLRWLYTALTRASKKLYLLNFSPKFF